MKLAVVITVRSPADAELARRSVAGQPWIARLAQRIRHATSVTRIVVACRTHADKIAALLDTSDITVVPAIDPLDAACDLSGDHDGVAVCGVEQLFVDPVRLDTLASQGPPSSAGRIRAVLACEPLISLTGGVFLEIVTRHGLLTATREDELAHLEVATWPTWPEPPEMRLEEHGDFDWAAAAYETLLARDPSGGSTRFEEVLNDPALRRVVFWDDLRRFALLDSMGRRAMSILTIRCMPHPLFDNVLRYLNRLHHVSVDVLCQTRTSKQTSECPGVGRVYAFDSDTFSLNGLESAVLDSIRERQYDLCVVPVREPTAWGFGNVVPLGDASRARSAVWLDAFGRCGQLPTPTRDKAPATWLCPPHQQADAYLRRAVRALDAFAKTGNQVDAPSRRIA